MPQELIFDTHAHLLSTEFDADRELLVSSLAEKGVSGIIEIAAEFKDWPQTINFAQKYNMVYAALGHHPHYAEEFIRQNQSSSFESELYRYMETGRVVAVGEIGLDYYKNSADPKVQRKAFEQQLSIWRKTELPLVIHTRQADEDMVSMLTEYVSDKPDICGVVHCFSGDSAFAEKLIQLGFLLGIDGPVTYSKNVLLKNTVKAVGVEHLLFETDCPYLAPEPMRGKRNEPAYITHTVNIVAELLGLDTNKVIETANTNARKLFRI